MDWLVIVGSYLSLSIALIGVKAKQSATPSTLNNTTNSIQLAPLQLPPTQLLLSQPTPLVSSSNQVINAPPVALINQNLENNSFRGPSSSSSSSLIQQSPNMLLPPPSTQQQSHMTPLLPTPLISSTILYYSIIRIITFTIIKINNWETKKRRVLNLYFNFEINKTLLFFFV
jgi:hypothetical protein